MPLDPRHLTDFQIAKNMIQRLVSEKGYSYEDAEAIVNRDLRSTVLAATRSNDRADYAAPMNAEVDKTVREKAVEAARQEARQELLEKYKYPLNLPQEKTDEQIGRENAFRLFEEARNKIKPYQQPTSQLGRLVAKATFQPQTAPEIEARRNEYALAQAKDAALRSYPTITKDMSAKDFDALTRQADFAKNILHSNAMTRSNITQGGQYNDMDNVVYTPPTPVVPPSTDAPVYDYDEHSVPKDFDTWGRKILGPSAATNSMDAPDNAVGFARKVLKSDQSNRAATPAAAPQENGGFFANAFKDPYAGMTSQQLWEEYNKTGTPQAFVRADKASMAERDSAKKVEKDEGKAKGGAVAGKDAALHKALEIIHHMLTRGH